MLIARFFDGLAGSAFLSVAGGTVGDVFATHVRHHTSETRIELKQSKDLSAPMMVYAASPFIGPEVGPLVGGFIVENTSWRW
jgi:MFS family permease